MSLKQKKQTDFGKISILIRKIFPISVRKRFMHLQILIQLKLLLRKIRKADKALNKLI